jgi:hypothetical protein
MVFRQTSTDVRKGNLLWDGSEFIWSANPSKSGIGDLHERASSPGDILDGESDVGAISRAFGWRVGATKPPPRWCR